MSYYNVGSPESGGVSGVTDVVIASASAAIDLVNHAPEEMLLGFYDQVITLPDAAAQVLSRPSKIVHLNTFARVQERSVLFLLSVAALMMVMRCLRP